ncbi:hypothetical protein Acr_00g0094970 [Actinidia rufa]|uniref:C2H2-type domain-containing protein n=1 Tax=Actinidia rufa TaxID=165716 RepID=A0A7J0DYU7_9ERIC|nr:hypothetical protein Acr_00g0094970 [Actinidia rufa]
MDQDPGDHQSEGKLWIKMKIPKIEEEGINGEDRIGSGPRKNDEPRVCSVCNKGFSSGKALGGHMRVHVQQAHLKDEKPPKKSKATTNYHHCNASESLRSPRIDKPTCTLCGKDFPSMKALFGHMRCHPEREWRGIQPPSHTRTKDSSSSSSVSGVDRNSNQRIDSCGVDTGAQVMDLSGCLSGWAMRDRRGRGAIADGSVTEEEQEEEEAKLRAAVHDLMRLARGSSLDSGLTDKDRIEEYQATNSYSLTEKNDEAKNWVFESKQRTIEVGYRRDCPVKKVKIDESAKNLETEKIPEKWVCGDILTDDELVGLSDGTVPSEELIKNYKCESNTSTRLVMMKSKKKRKKLKLRDLESAPVVADEPPPPPPDRYKCSTCNRCFSTHQALGGHRSYHNKAKSSHTVVESSSGAHGEESEANVIARADEIKDNEGSSSSKQIESMHRCKICRKTFLTGQALGGHKRCHWVSPAEAPSSQTTSPGETSQTDRKILGFDLNEVPSMEDEDGVESYQVGGYGYGFNSSHNSAIA